MLSNQTQNQKISEMRKDPFTYFLGAILLFLHKLCKPIFLVVFFSGLVVPSLLSQDIKPEAMRQIRSLMQEKESRTPVQRKINSQILYAYKLQEGKAIARNVPSLKVGVKADNLGMIKVDIKATVTPELLDRLIFMGSKIIHSSVNYNSITAEIPLSKIEQIAELEAIGHIDPWLPPLINTRINKSGNKYAKSKSSATLNRPDFRTRANRIKNSIAKFLGLENEEDQNLIFGSVTSEGDVTHRADMVRSEFNVDGTGVKIGVISDSYNAKGGAQADVLSGDLPGVGNPNGYTDPVVILADQAGNTDEGRAMLQLIHDLAPGAQLFFSTAFISQADFAQKIIDLRNAGCDIIVDDVSYLGEGVFQDDNVAQAVNIVTADGALYFSSAGNSGNFNDGTSGVWEGDFADGGTSTMFPGGNLHSFGATNFNTIAADQDQAFIILKWSDALGNSGNDYDLFITNSAGDMILGTSTNLQDGNDFPVEFIAGDRQSGERIYILKNAGEEIRALHLNTNRGRLSIATPGQVFGHNAAASTISVAATPASNIVPQGTTPGPFPNAFNAGNKVELFSSDGPRRIFFNPDGSAITPGNVLFATNGGTLLQKPDITAADGTQTSFFGAEVQSNFYFFGTSAAAPHAAAIAALIKEAAPGLTSSALVDVMKNTAIDIETPGVDRDAGHGIVMPLAAMRSQGLSMTNFFVDDIPHHNNNGIPEPGEFAQVTFELKNNSMQSISNISGELTSTSNGITIINGTKAFPGSIPAGGSIQFSFVSFVFAISGDVPCDTKANFGLNVSHDGAIPKQDFVFEIQLGRKQSLIQADMGSAPPTGVGFTSSAGNQTGQISVQTGPQSAGSPPNSNCFDPLPAYILSLRNTSYPFQAYTFNNPDDKDQCVDVDMIIPTQPGFYSVDMTAYNTNGFSPGNPLANILGTGEKFVFSNANFAKYSFSFVVPANEQFTIVVAQTFGTARMYNLDVNLYTCNDVPCPDYAALNLNPDITVFPISPFDAMVSFTGRVGVPFSQTFTASGIFNLYDFSFLGGVPGLSFQRNSRQSALSGIPTLPSGPVPFFIFAEDPIGCGTTGFGIYEIEIFPCDTVKITSPVISNSPICTNQSLELSVGAFADPDSGPLNYQWMGAGSFSNPNRPNTTVTGAVSGIYSVRVSNSCSQVISETSVVVSPPVAACKDITVQLDESGNASVAPSDVTDDTQTICYPISLTPNTFGCNDVGNQIVTLTVSDNASTTATCTATVTVVDQIPPIALCKDITVQLDETGNASITATQINNGSNDACGIASLSVSPNTFACNNIGSNTVTLTVTDINNNASTCTATVTVQDKVLPIAECQDITIHLDANGSASITPDQINNGSSDACGIASLSVSPNTFTCNHVGGNTVTLTVTDNNNNVKTCTATVTVVDTVAPQAVCQDITVQLDVNGEASITTEQINNGSSDACGIASMAVSPNTFSCGHVGANSVVLTVFDNNNNIKTCSATVTVQDLIAPVAMCKDITVQLDVNGEAYIDGELVDNGSTDACGIASLEVAPSSFTCNNIGPNQVILTVTDNNNNVNICTTTVFVQDNVPPQALCRDITVQLDGSGNASIIADQIDNGSSDACGIASIDVSPKNFTCADVGDNTVTLVVTDIYNNAGTCTATVTVEDNIPPEAVCKDITVYLEKNGSVLVTGDMVDNGSSDICGIKSFILDKMTFTCDDLGSNPVVLTVTDNNDNTDTCHAIIFVEDIQIFTIPDIVGMSPICPGLLQAPYSVVPDPNVTSYQWSYSGNGAIINNNGKPNVTIDFAPDATHGFLTVEYYTICQPSGITDDFSVVKGSEVACALAMNCQENLLVINTMISFPTAINLFKANNSVNSAATVEGAETVLFRAGQEINLLRNFEVEKGALFIAEIERCFDNIQAEEIRKKE